MLTMCGPTTLTFSAQMVVVTMIYTIIIYAISLVLSYSFRSMAQRAVSTILIGMAVFFASRWALGV